MHLTHYLALLHRSECGLAEAYRVVAETHGDEPDVRHDCLRLAAQCELHAAGLRPFVERYDDHAPEGPERLHADLFGGTRTGPLGLIRDLHDLYLMAANSDITWTLVGQAALALRDAELVDLVHASEADTAIQLKWLRTRMKSAAPQALVVAR